MEKCRRNKISGRKLNNRGMSLVEVIISITILSIVVVPTLHALTTAMVYNSKARKRQEVTLSGESIMEAFKGYDIETLKLMFDTSVAAADPTVTSHGDGQICYSDGTGKIFYQEPAGSSSDYSFTVDAVSGVYTFEITNLLTDTGKLYNIEMQAVPAREKPVLTITNMKTTDANVKCDIEWNDGIDEKALTDFADPHKSYESEFAAYMDSLVQTAEYPDDEAKNAAGNHISVSDVDKSNIVVHDRILEFQIGSDGITPVVTYHYYITGVAYYKPVHPPVVTDGYTGAEIEPGELMNGTLEYLSRYPEDTDSYIAITSTYPKVEASDLTNIYLFYYPDYSMQQDKVLIKNNSGISVNCYLLKQRSSKASEAWTTTHEQSYKVKVEKEGSDAVALYHNMNENIGTPSSVVAEPVIATAFANGSDSKGENIANVYNAGGTIKHSAAASEYTQQYPFYDLTLTIKDTSGTVVASLQSTMDGK